MEKYVSYEQFGIKVIDFLDKDVIACNTKKTGTMLLYKHKPTDKYVWRKEFVRPYLGKYNILFYEPSYEMESVLLSTTCFT